MSSSSKPTTPRAFQRHERRHSRRSSGLYKILPQSPKVHYSIDPDQLPLESEDNMEKFNDLASQIELVRQHMEDLHTIQAAITNGFNEPFASFLYGMNITMWCNNFPGRPTKPQWDRLRDLQKLDVRIDDLAEKVRVQREENEKLKAGLKAQSTSSQSRQQAHPTFVQPEHPTFVQPAHPTFVQPAHPTFVQPQAPRRIASQNQKQHSHTPTQALSAHVDQDPPSDASYQSNESFVENPRASRIPQLGRATRPLASTSSTLKRGTTPTTAASKNTGPNLNQPPRYMRGLFDGSNSVRPSDRPRRVANRSAPGRISKINNRPPFR